MDNLNKEKLLSLLSQKLGKSKEEILDGVQTGNMESVMNTLSAEQKSKINGLMADPELAKKLMQDKKVQEILRKLDS